MKQNSEDGNVTMSRLVMTPQPHDDGAHVTCRAKNALIPGAALEDSIKLDVQCNYYFYTRLVLTFPSRYIPSSFDALSVAAAAAAIELKCVKFK